MRFLQSIVSKLKKENSIYLIANVTNTAFAFISITLIAKFIGLDIVGQITSTIAISTIFVAFIQSASNSYIVQNYFKTNEQDAVVLSTYPVYFINLILLLSILSILYFYNIRFELILYIVFLAIIKTTYSSPLLVLRLNREPVKYFMSYCSGSLIKALTITLFIVLNVDTTTEKLLLIYVLADAIILLISMIFSFQFISFKNFSRNHVKENLKLSYSFLPHKIAKSVLDSSDILSINYFLSDEELGTYSIIKKGLSPANIAMKSILTKLNIDIAEFVFEKPKKLAEHIQKSFSRVWIIFITFSLFGLGYSYYITQDLSIIISTMLILIAIYIIDFSNLTFFAMNFQFKVKKLNLLVPMTLFFTIAIILGLNYFTTITVFNLLICLFLAKALTNLTHLYLLRNIEHKSKYGISNILVYTGLIIISAVIHSFELIK